MTNDDAARLWVERVSAVQGSYSLVSERCDSVEAHLTHRLSEDAPDLVQVLGETPTERSEWLRDLFDMIVTGMAHLNAILPTLRSVAFSYARQGLQPRHYEILRAAVMEALEQALGAPRFSPFLRESWDIAFSMFSRAMVFIGFSPSEQVAKELAEHAPAGLAPARASSY